MPRLPLATPLAALALAAGLMAAPGTAAAPAAAAPAAAAPVAAPAAARAANPVTPGNFTGFGFDQCLAPTQKMMNRWWLHSPYQAAGIYISGDSRACRNQPNLTPAWISRQLAIGWRLLPIILGPQASCQPRFPRYADDFRINPNPGRNGKYSIARKQGRTEAVKNAADAKRLGITPGSTLWYDLEGFNLGDTRCRESALGFVSGWSAQTKALGYRTGMYSSASSGIKMLDDARRAGRTDVTLPEFIWLARWDGVANTSSTYVTEAGWRPGGRVKQYLGGHDEVHGGVRINIDSNYLDLGTGSRAVPENRCSGTRIGFPDYTPLQPPKAGRTSPAPLVKAMQCLLKEHGVYKGAISGSYDAATLTAVNAWQARTGATRSRWWTRANWMSAFATGPSGATQVVKFGSYGPHVRRVQRALNAASPTTKLVPTGTADTRTSNAIKAWQRKVKLPPTGVINSRGWALLRAARR